MRRRMSTRCRRNVGATPSDVGATPRSAWCRLDMSTILPQGANSHNDECGLFRRMSNCLEGLVICSSSGLACPFHTNAMQAHKLRCSLVILLAGRTDSHVSGQLVMERSGRLFIVMGVVARGDAVGHGLIRAGRCHTVASTRLAHRLEVFIVYDVPHVQQRQLRCQSTDG